MVKHNNPIPKSRKKLWDTRVRINYNNPQKTKKRKEKRINKAAIVFPRPIKLLRPLVRCSSRRHNHRLKYGKGFTIEELKAVKIPVKMAPTIGISVDKRRLNLSEESLKLNVDRLKTYKSKLILFPKNPKKPNTKGPIPEATKEQLKNIQPIQNGKLLKIEKEQEKLEWETITEQQKKKSAVKALISARRSIKAVGYLVKKKREEEEKKKMMGKKKRR